MKFKIRNKLEITTNNRKYTFFNKMLDSVYNKYSSFESFNNCVLIGNGEESNNQKEYKLTNKILAILLNTEIIQNDISKGQLYIKKNFVINSNMICNNYIKEIGITDSINSTTIYNYFSLVNDEYPEGIFKDTSELYCTITLYLDIDIKNEDFCFLSGNNPFINYLLGEGLQKGVTAYFGDYYYSSDNSLIYYPDLDDNIQLTTTIKNNDTFELSFDFVIKHKIIKSIFLLINKTPFAVLKLQNYYTFTENSGIYTPKTHYIIDMGENIKSVKYISNTENNTQELNAFTTKYANEFGYEIVPPFANLFNSDSPKFVSNDGSYIAFVHKNNVYIFKNIDYQIQQINTHNLIVENIKSIQLIDDFVFIFSNIEPYIFSYQILNGELKKLKINFNNFNDFDLLKNSIKYAVSKTSSNDFMFGLIANENKNGHTLYFSLFENELDFTIKLTSDYQFSYVLAINSNNYCDAQIIYLQEGEYSYNSRIVTHYPDKTIKDVYSSLAYTLTKDAKEIYVKDRAIIAEKTTSPKIQIYHYPQVYQYLFPEVENENDYYISNNLLYMAVKKNDNTFHFYNLVGYNEIFEFVNHLPDYINYTDISNIIFMKDLFLIFFNNSSNILAFTLKQNKTLIENLSSNTSNYLINYEKYNFLGENNEGAIIKIMMKIKI